MHPTSAGISAFSCNLILLPIRRTGWGTLPSDSKRCCNLCSINARIRMMANASYWADNCLDFFFPFIACRRFLFSHLCTPSNVLLPVHFQCCDGIKDYRTFRTVFMPIQSEVQYPTEVLYRVSVWAVLPYLEEKYKYIVMPKILVQWHHWGNYLFRGCLHSLPSSELPHCFETADKNIPISDEHSVCTNVQMRSAAVPHWDYIFVGNDGSHSLKSRSRVRPEEQWKRNSVPPR